MKEQGTKIHQNKLDQGSGQAISLSSSDNDTSLKIVDKSDNECSFGPSIVSDNPLGEGQICREPTCKSKGKVLAFDNFTIRSVRKDGSNNYFNTCKACRAKERRDKYKAEIKKNNKNSKLKKTLNIKKCNIIKTRVRIKDSTTYKNALRQFAIGVLLDGE